MDMLQVSGVTKIYNGQPIFSDLDLSVAPGRFKVLVGPSGCGKSTLFDGLTGVMALDGGKISWNHEELPHLVGLAFVLAAERQQYAEHRAYPEAAHDQVPVPWSLRAHGDRPRSHDAFCQDRLGHAFVPMTQQDVRDFVSQHGGKSPWGGSHLQHAGVDADFAPG